MNIWDHCKIDSLIMDLSPVAKQACDAWKCSNQDWIWAQQKHWPQCIEFEQKSTKIV